MSLEPGLGPHSCCADLGRFLSLSKLGYLGGGMVLESLSCLGPLCGSASTPSDTLQAGG